MIYFYEEFTFTHLKEYELHPTRTKANQESRKRMHLPTNIKDKTNQCNQK